MSSETSCIVHRCRRRGGYRFPVNNDLKAAWLKAIRWAIPLEPKKTAIVCPTHFTPNEFETQMVDGHARNYLKVNAVPSIFPWNSDLWGNQESSSDPSEDEDEDEDALQGSSCSAADGDIIGVSDPEDECSREEQDLEESVSSETQVEGGITPSHAINVNGNVCPSTARQISPKSDDHSSRSSSSAHKADHLQDIRQGTAPDDPVNVDASTPSGNSSRTEDRTPSGSSPTLSGSQQGTAPVGATNGAVMTVCPSTSSPHSNKSDDQTPSRTSSARLSGHLQDSPQGVTPSDTTNFDDNHVGSSTENSTSSYDQASRGSSSAQHVPHRQDSRQGVTQSDATNVVPSIENQTSIRDSTTSDDRASSSSSGRISKPEELATTSRESHPGHDHGLPKLQRKRHAQEKSAAPPNKEKTRRNITKFTKDQRVLLEKLFEENAYPDPVRYAEISQNLGIQKPNVVKIWFQNRRAQFRKDAREFNVSEEEENGKTHPSTPAQPADNEVVERENQVLTRSNSSPQSDAETQRRLQKLWMYYAVDGGDIPQGKDLEEIAAQCGLTPEATKTWFEYAKRRFSSRKQKKNPTTKLLLRKFIQNCYPSSEDVHEMSYSTGMSPDEIHNWFRTERYWQTMYFNEEEGNKTSQEDHVPQPVSKRRKTPDSLPSESDMNLPAQVEPSRYNDQSQNDTDGQSVSMNGEDAPEIDLTRENESESTQPRPSSPLWSDSGSSVDITLPNVDSGPNQRVVIQHWVDKLLKRRRYFHTEPISEDDDDGNLVDLTEQANAGTSSGHEVAPKKGKKDDAVHSSSSDCEIIEPELPIIEIDSDDDQPRKPQTVARPARPKPPPKTASGVHRARKQNLVPRELSSSPQFSDKTIQDVFSIHLPGTDSFEAEQLGQVLKELGPLKNGSVIKTPGKDAYKVISVKHAEGSSKATRLVLAKLKDQERKQPGQKKVRISRKTLTNPRNSGKVVPARDNQPDFARNSDSSSDPLTTPLEKRLKTYARNTQEGYLAQPKSGIVRRVASGVILVDPLEVQNSANQSKMLADQIKSKSQFHADVGQVGQPGGSDFPGKHVTFLDVGTQLPVEREGLLTETTNVRCISSVPDEQMDTSGIQINCTKAAETGGLVSAQPGVICDRITTDQAKIVSIVPSSNSLQQRKQVNFVQLPGSGSQKPPVLGVVTAQNGQKIVLIQPSVQQKEQETPKAVTSTQQNTPTKQVFKTILIAPKSAPGGTQCLLQSRKSGEGSFSSYVNLVPEEDNLKGTKHGIVRLKTVYGLDGHCHFLESKLRGLDYSSRPLQVYKSAFLPELQHGLLYWGHCPTAKRIFALQKSIVGAILGVESAVKEQFVTLKLLTLPSMYVLQCLINVHKSHSRIRQRAQEMKLRQSNGNVTDKTTIPPHEINGLKLYKALPAEMYAMRMDVFIAVLKVFLHKHPLFSLAAYFEAVKSLGSNATKTTTPQ